jgi:hypothetical protein
MAKEKNTSHKAQPELDFRTVHALILSGILVAVYFLYSFISDGFYQDDEIAHYQQMRLFWQQPEVILGNWAKPGFKIVYVVPALFGYRAVLLVNALLTAFMAFNAWRIASHFKLRFAPLALILCGFQPMLFQLSFRTYSELLTGVLLSILVLSVLKDRFYAAAFLSTWLFTIRQEMLFLAPLVMAWLVWKKAYKAIPLMAIPPALLLLAGKLGYNDWFWVLSEMKAKGTDTKFVRQGFWHYWKLFTPVFGAVVTALFVGGLASLKNLWMDTGRRFQWAVVLLPLTGYFLVHCILTSEFANMSSSAGNLRYMVVLSPLVAVVALFGLVQMLESKTVASPAFVAAAAYALMVLMFFSYEYDHLKYTSVPDHSRWLMAFLTVGVVFTVHRFKIPPLYVILFVGLLVVGSTIYNEPPKKNSPENETIKAIAAWMESRNLLNRRVLINHPMFYFYANRQFRMPDSLYPGLYLRFLEDAAPGTIAIWDSHYSDRPEYKMDVPYTWFENKPEWKLMRQWSSPDRRYVALVFEKQPD